MDAMNQNLGCLKERDVVYEPVQTEHRYYGAVDLARFIAAMVIVGIHTEVFCQISLLDMGFGVISRLAVPLFFIISAFFFFSKPLTKIRIKHTIKRILILYFSFSIFYYLILWSFGYTFSWDDFCSFVFLGGFRHLWFLHALMIGILLTSGLYTVFKKTWGVLCVGVLVYIIGLMLETYYSVFSSIEPIQLLHDGLNIDKYGTRNGIFYGFPCIVLGLVIAKLKRLPSLSFSLGLSSLFILGLFIETWLAVKVLHVSSTIMWLSCLPATCFMMITLLNVRSLKFDTHRIRKMSTFIYLIHPAFILLLGGILGQGMLLFGGVLILSVLSAWMVSSASMHPRGKVLKYLV